MHVMLERIHLAIVREVARRGTLTAASEALCLTQSALSHTMRRLEERLGAPIWSRDGKRLLPTVAGRQVLSLAERVLPQLEQAEERLQAIVEGRRGVLRLGMECHPCHRWLQPLIGPFLAAWPDVDLDIRQRFQFGGVAALLAGEIDLLITPDPIVHAALEFLPVFDYEHVLVVSRNHRLAGRRQVEPEDLATDALLTYPVPRERLDIFTRFLLPAGVLPRQHRTIEDSQMLLEWVATGRAVTALPRWFVREQQRDLPLATVRLGRQGIAKQIHIGLRSADRGIAYIDAFIALARTARGQTTASQSRADPQRSGSPPRSRAK